MGRKEQLVLIQKRYMESIIEGKHIQAESVIEEACKQGYSVSEIYLEILSPAQKRLGKLWYQGKLNVAGEHLATQITLKQVAKLRQLFPLSRKLGLSIILSSVENEQHCLGLQMIADFFYFEGWDVDFLGSNVPLHDFIEFVRKRRPDIVAISVTIKENAPKVIQTIEALYTLPHCPKILIGGACAKEIEIPDQYKEIAYVSEATKAVKQAYLCLGFKENNSLPHYLQKLGQRIQLVRKSKKWTQQQLAETANLERTYISAVERGKQNVTVGAILKIARALDTSLEELLL